MNKYATAGQTNLLFSGQPIEGAGPAVGSFLQQFGPLFRAERCFKHAELPVHNVQAIRIFLHLLRIFFKRLKSSSNLHFRPYFALKSPKKALKWPYLALFCHILAFSYEKLQKTVHGSAGNFERKGLKLFNFL